MSRTGGDEEGGGDVCDVDVDVDVDDLPELWLAPEEQELSFLLDIILEIGILLEVCVAAYCV
jgi:hypothetical protein